MLLFRSLGDCFVFNNMRANQPTVIELLAPIRLDEFFCLVNTLGVHGDIGK